MPPRLAGEAKKREGVEAPPASALADAVDGDEEEAFVGVNSREDRSEAFQALEEDRPNSPDKRPASGSRCGGPFPPREGISRELFTGAKMPNLFGARNRRARMRMRIIALRRCEERTRWLEEDWESDSGFPKTVNLFTENTDLCSFTRRVLSAQRLF